ncbi:unnamed protein product [Heterobilharzia americana]|nr:unnamed protein product [Heterobilharzia americana]
MLSNVLLCILLNIWVLNNGHMTAETLQVSASDVGAPASLMMSAISDIFLTELKLSIKTRSYKHGKNKGISASTYGAYRSNMMQLMASIGPKFKPKRISCDISLPAVYIDHIPKTIGVILALSNTEMTHMFSSNYWFKRLEKILLSANLESDNVIWSAKIISVKPIKLEYQVCYAIITSHTSIQSQALQGDWNTIAIRLSKRYHGIGKPTDFCTYDKEKKLLKINVSKSILFYNNFFMMKNSAYQLIKYIIDLNNQRKVLHKPHHDKFKNKRKSKESNVQDIFTPKKYHPNQNQIW